MKLETALQHALSVWRTELDQAGAGVHLRSTESEVAARQVTVLVRYSGDVEALRQAGLQTGYDTGEVVSGIIALADLERLDAVPGVESVALVPRVTPDLDDTVEEIRVPWKLQPNTTGLQRGAGVIVAVIDTGIDIFHESFRKSDAAKSTRIVELWDQSAKATDGGSPPPAGFQQIGRVYSEENINAALAPNAPTFPSVDTNGHGTHVAGIAAGDGSQDDRCSDPGEYAGVAPEADLVVVKAITVANNNIPDAMRWCAEAGERLKNKLNPPKVRPVVVNCSFGGSTGPHDGTDALDFSIDQILRPTNNPIPKGIAFVVSAGNTGIDEIHESGTIAANASATIPFFVPNGSTKVDTLDIWYTGTASLNVELIAPPNAARPGTRTTGTVAPIAPPPPNTPPRKFVIGLMELTVTSLNVAHSNNKKQINVTITPTNNAAVRNGDWQLKLTNTTGVAANWDAWFFAEHGDSYPTFRMPSESEPVDRRRVNTIGSPGTSRNAITVANHEDGGELNETSSRGAPNQPVAPAGEIKPTLAAPGTAVASARSRGDKNSNSSCCDQLVVDKTGTSMSAPHVAGVVALMFQKNKDLNFEQVRGHLQKACHDEDIPEEEKPPVIEPDTGIRGNHLWGSGKLNAEVALASIPAAAAVAAAGGAGGPAQPLAFAPDELGWTPHTIVSRLADLQRRFGSRPGLQLFAALVSDHVDEALRLVNTNRRVLVVWRRLGGPQLVRRLLYKPPPNNMLLPREVDGRDVGELLTAFLEVLEKFAGPRLRADLARFADFARLLPGATLDALDKAALAYGGGR